MSEEQGERIIELLESIGSQLETLNSNVLNVEEKLEKLSDIDDKLYDLQPLKELPDTLSTEGVFNDLNRIGNELNEGISELLKEFSEDVSEKLDTVADKLDDVVSGLVDVENEISSLNS